MEKKLRIAWFSPLARSHEPVVTFSQYCTDLLVPMLKDSLDIEIFSSLYPGEHLGVPRHHYLSAYLRHRAQPFDLFFYQLEDGPLGRAVRTQIGLMPGVTWAHDVVLLDPGAEGIHESQWEHTVEQYLNPSLPFADREKPPHQFQPEAYREVSLSPVVLFSSAWGRRQLEKMVSRRLEYVPGGHRSECLSPPVARISHERCFRDDRHLRIVATGATTIEGRAHKFLPALAELQSEWSLTWVIPAGERGEAERLLVEFGVLERVNLIEGNSPQLWRSLVATSDVALHLHASRAGHLSPYVELSMAAGLPVIAVKCASGEVLPEDAVFVVTPGMHETTQIREILNVLVQDDPHRFGSRGQSLVERENDPVHIARRLEDTFRRAAPVVQDVMAKWAALYSRAEEALLGEIRGLIDAPVGDLPSSYPSIVEPFVAELRSGARR